jgi:hypothetical protein
MLKRIGRLFVLKTRTEVWLVIYAIAVGAIERGQHYLAIYPGTFGLLLALASTGVVFLAGAKLLDAVTPAAPAVKAGPYRALPRRRASFSRNRPKARPRVPASGSPLRLRKD